MYKVAHTGAVVKPGNRIPADQLGGLARLFQAAGEAGVNIEDIGIEHSPGLPSGVAELAVKPAAAGPLVAALTARGWPAYAPQAGPEPGGAGG
jgi:hypothetical protein